jgi:hypothetical protein
MFEAWPISVEKTALGGVLFLIQVINPINVKYCHSSSFPIIHKARLPCRSSWFHSFSSVYKVFSRGAAHIVIAENNTKIRAQETNFLLSAGTLIGNNKKDLYSNVETVSE